MLIALRVRGGRSYQCATARADFGLRDIGVGLSSSSQRIKPKSCLSLLLGPQSATVVFAGFIVGRKKSVNSGFCPFMLVTAAVAAVYRRLVVGKVHHASSGGGGV